MHQINDAIVQGGKLELSNLPFGDGQHVRVLVTEVQPATKASIYEVRRMLKNGVEHFEEPFEPMVPTDHWEMLK